MAVFRYAVVASSLHAPDAVERIIAPVESTLSALGGQRCADPASDPSVPFVVLVATGGTEAAILELCAARSAVAVWEPIVLVAHPLHNSLPASLEALARLRQDGRRGRVVPLGAAGEPDVTIADLVAVHRLHGARLGLVGRPSEWLVASVPDREAVRAQWGVELVDIDIAAPIAAHRHADPVTARAVAVTIGRRPDPDAETLAAAAVHPALTEAIERYAVDAVTVRCFDFLGELHTSGCLALAGLNDAGTVAGCEGDVAGALAMMLVREVLGSASWIANPAEVDVAAGRMMLAHCTVAPSLVGDLSLHTHFESGIGIGLRGTFTPGPVTLLRFGGRSLEEHWITDAEIVGTGDAPDLCRTQVRLAVPSGRLEELLERPLGNHLVLAPGHHAARLERWLRLAMG